MKKLSVKLEEGILGERRSLGLILLLGWTTIMALIAITNLTDLFYSFGWLSWAFRSGNVEYIGEATSKYISDETLSQWLLGVIVVGQFLIVAFLGRAAWAWKFKKSNATRCARAALALLAAQWLAFYIGIEIFVSYRAGVSNTWATTELVATLATIFVIELVGDSD